MANCSYARCVQERRLIKRELQKWTRSMVYVVGLERVAEELMGRRKWALYQDVLSTSIHLQGERPNYQQQQQVESTDSQSDIQTAEQKNATAYNNGHVQASKSPSTNDCSDEKDIPPSQQCHVKEVRNGDADHKCSHNPDPANAIPIDWDPSEKCNFCDEGKLFAVNDKGELVPETGSGNTGPDPTNTIPADSESDSSENGFDLNKGNFKAHKPTESLKDLLKNQSKMTSLESVVAAVASMHGLPSATGLSSLYPGLWYPFGNLQSDGGDSSGSTNGKGASSEDQVGSGNPEQPLDLSAKSSSTSGLDQRNIFKAKPRMTTISGRRTYTEDELQNALQDILSGKLGTRRAAVLYGIPRSTLRNKVYKLAIEQKREANLPVVAPVLADLDDDERDCSGAEEEKDVERTLHSLPSEDVFRLAASQSLAAFEKLQNVDRSPGMMMDEQPQMSVNVPEHSPAQSKPQTPALPMNMMDPNIILQGLLIGGALSGLTNNKALESTLGMLPEFLRNILLHNELLKTSEGRTSKSETPETASVCSTGRSGSENNENVEEHQLKVPSLKSLSGSGRLSTSPLPSGVGAVNFLNKNGGDPFPKAGIHNSGPLPIPCNTSHTPNLLGVSPTYPRETGSPPVSGIGSLREAIAHSISKTMHPPIQLDKRDSLEGSSHVRGPSLLDHYKWPTISVKKDLGAEVNRFGSLAAPGTNLLSSNASLNAQMNNSTGTGGKGTRPKRGKYRNYDRDSLVEAVKAVQRGEMSVHRAGSYYGVPHSTLEYKVKERHLMRPRKREPKPQPLDDRNANCSASAISMKANDVSSRNPAEKPKIVPGPPKSPLKAPQFETIPGNGVKGTPYLDSGSIAQLPYSQHHMFWPPHPPNFPGMSIDFSRAAAAAAATSDSFFAAQMRQRFQEHAANSEAGNSGTSNSSGSSGNNSANNSKSTTPNSAVPSNSKGLGGPKTAREFAESLYEGGSANGLLDGIIRHSLDRKTELHHGTLLDQLTNNLQLNKTTDLSGVSRKRVADSPLDFGTALGIKRERASPAQDDMAALDSESEDPDAELVTENLLQARASMLESNGSDLAAEGTKSSVAFSSNSDSNNAGTTTEHTNRHAIVDHGDNSS